MHVLRDLLVAFLASCITLLPSPSFGQDDALTLNQVFIQDTHSNTRLICNNRLGRATSIKLLVSTNSGLSFSRRVKIPAKRRIKIPFRKILRSQAPLAGTYLRKDTRRSVRCRGTITASGSIVHPPQGDTDEYSSLPPSQRAERDNLCKRADFNSSGSIDAADLTTLLTAWNTSAPSLDLTNDGMIGSPDLAILLGCYRSHSGSSSSHSSSLTSFSSSSSRSSSSSNNAETSGEYVEEFNDLSRIQSTSGFTTPLNGTLRINTTGGEYQPTGETLGTYHMNSGLLLDSSSNQNHAQCSGTRCPAAADGVLGEALLFQNGDFASIPGAALSPITDANEFTLSFWVKFSSQVGAGRSYVLTDGPVTLERLGGPSPRLVAYVHGWYPTGALELLSFGEISLPDDEFILLTFTYKTQNGQGIFTAHKNGGTSAGGVTQTTFLPIHSVSRGQAALQFRSGNFLHIGSSDPSDSRRLNETVFDELLILGRALAPNEVAQLSNRMFTGELFSRSIQVGSTLTSVGVTLDSMGINQEAISIELSTDGQTFCPLPRSGYYGFGEFNDSSCLLPAHTGNLIYRLIVQGPPSEVGGYIERLRVNWTTLTPICSDQLDNDGDGFSDRADFGCNGTADQDENDAGSTISIGTNLMPAEDFDPSLIFVDVFKTNRAWLTINETSAPGEARVSYGNTDSVHIPMNPDGYPLQIPYVVDTPEGRKTLKVHTLMMNDVDYNPAGNYTLICEGRGTISLRSNATADLSCPGTHMVAVNQGAAGVNLIIQESLAHDPIKRIRFILPQTATFGNETVTLWQGQWHTGNPDYPKFNQHFLSRFRGFKAVRFMDWMKANGSDEVRWDKRITPQKVSQSNAPRRRIPFTVISSNSSSSPSWFGNRETLTLRTQHPHGLDTAQTADSISSSCLLPEWFRPEWIFIEVINSTTLRILRPQLAQGNLLNCAGDMDISPELGVAVEHQVDLANALEAAPWFNIPHAADDSWVQGFASVVAQRFDSSEPERKIYVEYCNECAWQVGFFQQTDWLSFRAASDASFLQEAEESRTASTYYAHRAAQVFDIFRAQFPPELRSRIVRVFGGQAVNTYPGETGLEHLVRHHGHGAETPKVDAYSPAAYFGPHVTAGTGIIDLIDQGLTSRQLLDKTFEQIDQFIDGTDSLHIPAQLERNAALAQRYNLDLVAYEGGQHLLAVGSGERCIEELDFITQLWGHAQRDPRMYQAYQKLLRRWNDAGGGLFMHYNSVSRQSKWGYWGALEHLFQPAEEAPRYCFLKERIDGFGGAGSCSTRMRSPVLSGRPLGICFNGLDDNGDGEVDN